MKLWRAIAPGVKALVGLLVAAAVAFVASDDLRDNLCGSRFGERTRALICDISYHDVDDVDAAIVLRDFIGRASGTTPADAWPLLASTYKQDTTKQEFIERWEPSLWAEILESLKPTEARNTFELELRNYLETERIRKRGAITAIRGRVEERPLAVALRQTHDGPRIVSIRTRPDTRNDPVTFPRVEVRVLEDLHQLPVEDSEVTVFASEMKQGGQLTGICQVDTSLLDRPAGDVSQWWTRTPQGWITNRALLESSRPHAELENCGDLVLENSASLADRG